MSALGNIPSITPFLWFNANAEEAVNFYLSVFKDARCLEQVRSPGESGQSNVLTVSFELLGQKFIALNGGPHFKFNEAVSFVIRCESQANIDAYWEKLTAGGQPGQCGWLKDKFGLSWQVIPARLPELIQHPKSMQAMMQMTKLDIAELERSARE